MEKFTFTVTGEINADKDILAVIEKIGIEGVIQHVTNDLIETMQVFTDLTNVKAEGVHGEVPKEIQK